MQIFGFIANQALEYSMINAIKIEDASYNHEIQAKLTDILTPYEDQNKVISMQFNM